MVPAFANTTLVADWDDAAPWASALVCWDQEVNPNATSAIVVKNFAVMIADQLNVESTTASEFLPST